MFILDKISEEKIYKKVSVSIKKNTNYMNDI